MWSSLTNLSVKISLLIVIIAICHVQTLACVCIDRSVTPIQEMAGAKFVFAGKVLGREQESQILFTSKFPFFHKVFFAKTKLKFEVKEVWKGDLSREIVTRELSGLCSVSFEEGKEYLVYAYGRNWDDISTGCTRTSLLASANEDLAALGKGRIPTSQPARATPVSIAIFALLLSLALPIMFLWFLKRRGWQP